MKTTKICLAAVLFSCFALHAQDGQWTLIATSPQATIIPLSEWPAICAAPNPPAALCSGPTDPSSFLGTLYYLQIPDEGHLVYAFSYTITANALVTGEVQTIHDVIVNAAVGGGHINGKMITFPVGVDYSSMVLEVTPLGPLAATRRVEFQILHR